MIVTFRKQKKLEALQVKLIEHFEAEEQKKKALEERARLGLIWKLPRISRNVMKYLLSGFSSPNVTFTCYLTCYLLSFRKAEEEKRLLEKLRKELEEERARERQRELQRQLEEQKRKEEELRFTKALLFIFANVLHNS